MFFEFTPSKDEPMQLSRARLNIGCVSALEKSLILSMPGRFRASFNE